MTNQHKRGVLLVNLGTPDAPETPAVKRYLKQFLSDPRVVDVSPLLWQCILRGIVLPFRSPRVAKLYQSIWMEEGSPLLVYSRRQQAALAAQLPGTPVALGMSYGSPSLESAVDTLLEQGVTHLDVLPLYPQYSCSTTGAVFDGLADIFKRRRTFPSLNFIRSYATHPLYIEALAQSAEAAFAEHGEPDRLILSYHGIPVRYAEEGDIYPEECEATTALLRERLRFPAEHIMHTYQSRFGREPWLTPYTDETMKGLPLGGVRSVQVMCPGFSADCLETLEEIKEQNKGFFLSSGGEEYHYIESLNDDDIHIKLLHELVG
ncbi:ferrochelatase [Morganella morganii]|uniref:ferrochelatase n=1 Tax=Morganella morganii TaxID=582 RepID=UPI000D1EC800|nr:ferrochelatase [Morganella morganii]HAE76589.1 ferrochelatase [Morganella sp. (in: enterobacteria)]QXO42059.1 ferrochelatase [Morganella morganii]QXO45689.1 ferrochelatase [Morganella morganii]QXO49349.1 ferrochelatase [Morganella morganii]QXO53210.1 ferrochelatase [Morganella morganii]